MRELNTAELASVAGGFWGCFSWFRRSCKPVTVTTCKPTTTCAPTPSTCDPKAPTPEIN